MMIALALNQAFRGRGWVRTIAILPWALPTALIALAWRWIFNGEFGVWNDILLRLQIISDPGELAGRYLTGPWSAVIAADVWKTTSFVAILLLAGLQAIPPGSLRSPRHRRSFPLAELPTKITLPLIAPQILIAMLFRFAQAFGIFDLIQVMTGGGPGGATENGFSLYLCHRHALPRLRLTVRPWWSSPSWF